MVLGIGFPQREAECQANPQLAYRMSIEACLANSKVERELIVHLPYQAHQARYRLCHAKFVFVEHLRDRTDFPSVRSFHDGADEHVGMLVASQFGLNIEMSGAPTPALRHDSSPAGADAGRTGAVRQEDTEFRGNARTG